MNILFFLTPKNEVDCVFDTDTMYEAIQRMKNRQFSTIPIISRETGRYVGTLSEGDILWDFERNDQLSDSYSRQRPVMKLKRKRTYRPVNANADIEELFNAAKTQNFVPVVDDTGVFIGIVTRKSIMQYLINYARRLEQGRNSIA